MKINCICNAPPNCLRRDRFKMHIHTDEELRDQKQQNSEELLTPEFPSREPGTENNSTIQHTTKNLLHSS